MYAVYNLTTSPNVSVEDQSGPFRVLKHKLDYSIPYENAMEAWFAAKMGKHKRQLVCSLDVDDVRIAEGMMQWMVGYCEMDSGVRNVTSLFGKMITGKMTGQKAVSPCYRGEGTIVCEPVDDEILLIDLAEWPDGIVISPNSFLACSGGVRQIVTSRTSLSSAVFAKEGLFSMRLDGEGTAAILSPCVEEQLILVEITDDVLRVDGSFAIAWSGSLTLTVETPGSSATASFLSKEGLVNTYRGTGKVLLAPFIREELSEDALADSASKNESASSNTVS